MNDRADWTTDRPTKPGKYELSLHPATRPPGFRRRMEVEVVLCPRWMLEQSIGGVESDERVLAVAYRFDGTPRGELADQFFDRALWRPYVEPADPHTQLVPKADAGRSVAEALEAALADVAIGAVEQGATGPKPAAATQRVRDVFFEYVGRVREQAYEDGRAVEREACVAKHGSRS